MIHLTFKKQKFMYTYIIDNQGSFIVGFFLKKFDMHIWLIIIGVLIEKKLIGQESSTEKFYMYLHRTVIKNVLSKLSVVLERADLKEVSKCTKNPFWLSNSKLIKFLVKMIVSRVVPSSPIRFLLVSNPSWPLQ